MKEADVRLKIKRGLEKLGYWCITQTDAVKCHKCGSMFYPEKGRPDMLCLHPQSPAIVIETKVLKLTQGKSFPFLRVKEEQRRWLCAWAQQLGMGFLGLGIIGQQGSKDRLEAVYLIQWERWLTAEQQVKDEQLSIPYQEYKGMNSVLRQNGWTISSLFRKWQLPYESGVLRVPIGHPTQPGPGLRTLPTRGDEPGTTPIRGGC